MIKITRQIFALVFFVGLSIAATSPTLAQTAPTISTITDNRNAYPNSQIPAYEKFEITFSINTAAQNLQFPYDPSPPNGIPAGAGITVNAEFSHDNWATIHTLPAFYYQEFTEETRNNRDWLYPTGNYVWKVRFAPPTAGNWQYRLRVQDANGSTQSSAQAFTVTSSANKGFIRVSPNDSRYFAFEDGTYFPGLGTTFRATTDNLAETATRMGIMNQNGMQFGRMWLSAWSIFGAAWNPWYAMPQDYDATIPRPGIEAYQGDFRLKLQYRASNPNQPTCTDNCSYWKATRFIGWQAPQASVKPDTNYRIRVRYQGSNITGPRNASSQNYGIVVKVANQWLEQTHNTGVGGAGAIVTNYGSNTTSWQEITGTWNSGTNNYLPYLYITLENVSDPGPGNPAPVAYIDQVVVEEVLGNDQFGPNVLNKPSMQHHTYYDQKMARQFDRLLDLAKQNDVYLSIVLLEKEDYILNHIDHGGNLRTDDPVNMFYGDGNQSNTTAVEWYEKAWWRYAQARWGYSTNLHSWELLNEGNPNLAEHRVLADEMGAFMKTFAPNHHLVSTSTWGNSTSNWNPATYPNIDFADFHQYVPRTNTTNFYDSTLAAIAAASQYSRNGRPLVRGETGFTAADTGPSSIEIPCSYLQNQNAPTVWLSNFVWPSVASNAIYDPGYWYPADHIYPSNYPADCDGNSTTPINRITYDIRPAYGMYYDFIKDVPLANGQYADIEATVNNANIRVLGQKDITNGRAHFWVQNIQYTWKNVADGVTIVPQSGTITVSGFQANTQYVLQEWHTLPSATPQPQPTPVPITSSSTGTLTVPISSLSTSKAFKINSTTSTPSACYDVTTVLDAAQQGGGITSSARGAATARLNITNNTLRYKVIFEGLTTAETMSHIHGFSARGANSGIIHDLPLGSPKEGTWNYSTAQEENIRNGLTYFNIHTSRYTGGEIRGQIDNFREVDCSSPFPEPVLTPNPTQGDVNGDGNVTIADLSILLSNFGGTGKTRGQGDVSGNDGNVTIADLSTLLANFGN